MNDIRSTEEASPITRIRTSKYNQKFETRVACIRPNGCFKIGRKGENCTIPKQIHIRIFEGNHY